MNKRKVVGFVLTAAAFGAVWASGLASADDGTAELPPATNSVVGDVRPDNGDTSAGFPWGGGR